MTTAMKKAAAAVAMCVLVAACHPAAAGRQPFEPTPTKGTSMGADR
jgi:hypothetical protein